MKVAKIIILFLASFQLIKSAPIPVDQDEENNDFSLIDVCDNELELEIRRRWLGGPWSPEDTNSIVNEALMQLSGRNQSSRVRKFSNEAKYLLEIVSGEAQPRVEFTEDNPNDVDFYDEAMQVGEGHTATEQTMRKILDMADGVNGQKRRSQSSIENLYPWYRPYMLSRFRARLQGETRISKLRALDKSVGETFAQARRNLQPVHGRMIQRWAKQWAAANSLGEFGASDGWLNNFKRRHGIVSRKVTLYASRSQVNNAENIKQRIANFSQSYSRASIPFSAAEIWNFDQTGFNYEPSNLRTLSYRGERDTTLLLESRNKHTHSYTVQPMISRDGKLFPKLLIVTQEPSNSWGPIVGPQVTSMMQEFGNVEIYPSTSGKLTSVLIDNWFNTTLRQAVEGVKARKHGNEDEPAVLILADAWTGHSKGSQVASLRDMGARLLRIPPGTTDKLQPLDVNFNRQLKIFYNRIMEEAFYIDIMNKTTTRRGIVNIHSLMHNQISSPVYRDMILHAWRNTDPSFNTSELTNRPPKMVQANQFTFDQAANCQVDGCNEHAFIKCAHCGRLLCLEHFLNRTCFHTSQSRPPRSVSHDTCDQENCEEDTDSAASGTSEIQNVASQAVGLANNIASMTDPATAITRLATGSPAPNQFGSAESAAAVGAVGLGLLIFDKLKSRTTSAPQTTASPVADLSAIESIITTTTRMPRTTTTKSPTRAKPSRKNNGRRGSRRG